MKLLARMSGEADCAVTLWRDPNVADYLRLEVVMDGRAITMAWRPDLMKRFLADCWDSIEGVESRSSTEKT